MAGGERPERARRARCRRAGWRRSVVGRDGEAYPVDRWAEAAVFRSGEQRNLLVADNRTRDYAEGDARYRRKLTRLAWGPSAA